MNLSVIIPVHNGGDHLQLCLDALAASSRSPDEVIVVDDASTDRSHELAQAAGASVIRLPDQPRGPAFARNRGAEIAQGHILVFLDSDAAIHNDALARMERLLTKHTEIAALFGSYDADPPAHSVISRYKNLLHHYVHQHGRREASTFWAGCGAIRSEVFASIGGFSERYQGPAIEDIELGARLRRAGYRIRLCPDVQVTHLKRWTFGSLLRSDIFDRAIPWARLILQRRHLPADLVLDLKGRLSAVVAWVALALLVVGFWWSWAWVGMLLCVAAGGIANADLYRFFARHGGVWFAVGAAGLHALYLLYSSLVFALVAGQTLLSRLPFLPPQE